MDKVNLITLNKFLFLFLYKNLITMYNVDELSRLLLRIGDNSFSWFNKIFTISMYRGWLYQRILIILPNFHEIYLIERIICFVI